MPEVQTADLRTITIADTLAGLKRGDFTAVALMNAYLARIEEVDHLCAVLETNHRCLALAAQSDARRLAGGPMGALEGVPILIKDAIATERFSDADMQTTAGSFALFGSYPAGDSDVVRKLKDVGAIIIGKTNQSQLSIYVDDGICSAGSARGGIVKGAFHARQCPGGSSSGAAVAMSVGLASTCLGTDSSGSTLLPAHLAGVVGVRPTFGLVSTRGCIGLSLPRDTPGAITRCVADAAALLCVIADPTELSGPLPDYLQACRSTDVTGLRVGIPSAYISRSASSLPKGQRSAFDAAARVLSALGVVIVEEADPTDVSGILALNKELATGDPTFGRDAADALREYLATLAENPNAIHSLDDLLSFTERTPRETQQGDGTVDMARPLRFLCDASRMPVDEYDALRCRILAAGTSVVDALERHQLDALILPTAIATALPTWAGLPAITIPIGSHPKDVDEVLDTRGTTLLVAPGTPFGLTFIGCKWTESTLFRLAHALEQKMDARARLRPLASALPRTQLVDVISSQ